MIRFHFNERKTAHAAATLLRESGGSLPYMVLIKLLYLADRSCLEETGCPITGDRYVSMDKGPVLSHVLDLINEGPRPNDPSPWFQYVSEPNGYDVCALNDFTDQDLDSLSDFETALLRQAWERFGSIKKWDLIEILHTTLPEWEDPNGSMKPIPPERVLRALGKTDAEIQQVEADGAANDLDLLLSGL